MTDMETTIVEKVRVIRDAYPDITFDEFWETYESVLRRNDCQPKDGTLRLLFEEAWQIARPN